MVNFVDFGGDPVADTDSESLFHFPHHCRIGAFILEDLLVFLIHHRPIFTTLGEVTDSTTFWRRFSRHPHPDPDSSGNLDSNPGSVLVEVRCLGGGFRSSLVCNRFERCTAVVDPIVLSRRPHKIQFTSNTG